MIAMIRMSAGLALWAAVFCLLYALHGVGCEAGWATTRMLGMSLHRVVLLAAWIAGSGAALLLALALRRHPAEAQGGALVQRVSVVSAWVGFGATVAGGLPVLLVPACL